MKTPGPGHVDGARLRKEHGPGSPLRRTPDLILGPFYPADREAPVTADLTLCLVEGNAVVGDPRQVTVTIVDQDGNALQGGRAERYRHVLDAGPAPIDPCKPSRPARSARIKRFIWIAGLALAACMSLSYEVPSELAPTGVLRVGIAVGPTVTTVISVMGPDGQPRGPTTSLGRMLGQAAGLPVRFTTAPNTGELTDLLVAGEIDVAFMPVDEARRQRVDFSPGYVAIESTYLARPGLGLVAVQDVDRAGVRIVGIADTATGRAAAASLHTNKVQSIPSIEEAVELLADGKADAFAFPRDGLRALATRVPGSVILDGAYLRTGAALAIPKGRPQALEYVSRFLQQIRRDGRLTQTLQQAQP